MKNSSQFTIACWVSCVLWMATICYLSSLGGNEVQPWMLKLLGWDKLMHFGAFAAGAFCFSISIRRSTSFGWKKIVWTVTLIIALFGAFDEWRQLYSVDRSGADVGDWIADVLGGCIGAFITSKIYAIYKNGQCKRENSLVTAGN